ncbi:hypothetical protein BCR32DRAFT_300318 [Anaeromyces robustus]|uniref:Uncharacterized protein n=1 Tax=Anaeromyces robustus TaxID=1754192 RepID=A0A1Y1X357_9FUNG|nr:hypothetical protein BCR32DRAFT_300318 [Anaeromyces robustus]|eukprot:ORX80237.1 hypothetical protein BCR32DRAFT_300318 [Anaeromyces robustus]
MPSIHDYSKLYFPFSHQYPHFGCENNYNYGNVYEWTNHLPTRNLNGFPTFILKNSYISSPNEPLLFYQYLNEPIPTLYTSSSSSCSSSSDSSSNSSIPNVTKTTTTTTTTPNTSTISVSTPISTPESTSVSTSSVFTSTSSSSSSSSSTNNI